MTKTAPHAAAAKEHAARGLNAVRSLDLLCSLPCSGVEAIAAATFFTALAFAVFGVYLPNGGLAFDDWTLAYDIDRSREAGGLVGAFNHLLSDDVLSGSMAGRPVEAAYDVLLYAAFGQNAVLHLGAAIVLAALVAFLFYVVLRWLGLERLHAGMIATLVLLFPAADSTVFWATGAIAHAAIVLYLVGLICALRGLRARGRAAVAFHGLAAALYAASILQYQVAAPFVFISVLAYRLTEKPWRRWLTPWIGHAVVGVAALLYVRANLQRQEGSLSDSFRHARDLAGGARRLLESLGIQGGPHVVPTLAIVALLLAAAAGAALLRDSDPVRAQLRRWLLVALAGFVTIGAAYTIFIPADFYYWPLAPGIGNRVNAAAALGFAIVIYSLAVLAALLVVRALRLQAAVSTAGAIGSIAVASLAAAYVWTLNSDRQQYERAATLQRQALAVIENDVPRPAPGTTVWLFGIEGEPSRNVFTFAVKNDLTAALRLLLDDDTIEGIPASTTEADWSVNTKANSGISCRPQGVQPRGWIYLTTPPSRYGKTLFVDVRSRTSEPIRTRDDCEAALPRYRGRET